MDASSNWNECRIEYVATVSVGFNIRRVPSTGDEKRIVKASGRDDSSRICTGAHGGETGASSSNGGDQSGFGGCKSGLSGGECLVGVCQGLNLILCRSVAARNAAAAAA